LSSVEPVDGVLFVSFGGPETPDQVWPFLDSVAQGRGIPRERLTTVAEHYLALGGRSPINDQNRAVLKALGPALAAAGQAGAGLDLPVFWGNRHLEPSIGQALDQARQAGCHRLLALVTSAYPSFSGCLQYRGDLLEALAGSGPDGTGVPDLQIRQVRPFAGWDPDPHGWTARFAGLYSRPLVQALQQNVAAGLAPAEVEVLFTTHSLPMGMAERSGQGGDYLRNHLRVAEEVVRQIEVAGLRGFDWRLVFQSRSGPPSMPWLEPDVNEAIEASARAGRRAVVVVPIGFLSDHMEVLWDLDHQARDTAQGCDLVFGRVETPGADPDFVALLADVIRFAAEDPSLAGPVDRPCRPGCCGEFLPMVPSERLRCQAD